METISYQIKGLKNLKVIVPRMVLETPHRKFFQAIFRQLPTHFDMEKMNYPDSCDTWS